MWSYLRLARRLFSTTSAWRSRAPSAADAVRTDVSKDVVLFHHDNGRLCSLISLFGVTQLTLSLVAASFMHDTLPQLPVPEPRQDRPWYGVDLTGERFRNVAVTACVVFGGLAVVCSALYSLRSVSRLVLLRGGARVEVVTRTPFFTERSFSLPVESMGCRVSRTETTSYLPLKARGVPLYFCLDVRGTFPDPKLFDWSVGMKRSWT